MLRSPGKAPAEHDPGVDPNGFSSILVGELSLRIADPGEVVTGDGEGEKIVLQCGPRQLPAVIGYVPEQNEAAGTQGRVKYFRPRQ